MIDFNFPFSSTGIIQYDPPRPAKLSRGTAWWAIIKTDREITRYFRYWVDKEILNKLGFEKGGLCQPSFDAHISIVRGQKDIRHGDIEIIKKLWKKYDGEKVTFNYNLNVRFSGDTTGFGRPDSYWFIDCECPIVDKIRTELGLRTGFKPHMTIGRTW